MKKEIMYVFFDIDGVLNKKSDWKNKYSIDIDCVKVFSEIVKYYKSRYSEVRLVICSTWRLGWANNMNNSAPIDKLKELFESMNLKIYDKTSISQKSRQEEIEYYIKRNNVKKYIILDDDKSLFPCPDNVNLYCPNYLTGLTKQDLKNIKKEYV